jgi:hypothetical protein
MAYVTPLNSPPPLINLQTVEDRFPCEPNHNSTRALMASERSNIDRRCAPPSFGCVLYHARARADQAKSQEVMPKKVIDDPVTKANEADGQIESACRALI